MEAIGNVVLNLNYYGGEDLYSEGPGEDLLLSLVKEHPEEDYPALIQGTRSWSVMYHLSAERENICSFLPISKDDRVLEIGSGCGAITGCLSSLAGHVTCIELSKKRSTINAVRHRMLDNIDIIVGNFEDVEGDLTEKYDYITLIGVLEYAESYINSPDPYRDFLKRVSGHLKDDGKLVIAIENQLGLKYFAGCREDHTGVFYEGIEGYVSDKGVRTFSRKGLTDLLFESGFESTVYYPYPDYKLPHTIYSDRWLPGPGDLDTNIRNFDSDRLLTFDETRVFDTLIKEGKFPDFSNSFLVLARQKGQEESDDMPIYAKYASQRRMDLRTVTVISENKSGDREVYKRALSPKANSHIDGIYVSYLALEKEYENTGAKANVCTRKEDGSLTGIDDDFLNETRAVNLEYLKGITFEDYLDDLEKKGEYEKMLLMLKLHEKLIKSVSREKFENSEGFVSVFGEEINGDYSSGKVTDLDMIFSNIVFDEEKKENGAWNILDYEWTFNFPIPDKFVIYRALFYYLKGRAHSPFLKYLRKRGLDLYAEFSITMAEKEIFKRLEEHFQLNIIGGMASLTVMHELMPTVCADVRRLAKSEFVYRDIMNPVIYYGTGMGFSPDKQIPLFADVDGHDVSVDIPVEEGVTELRIDPCEYPCIVKIKRIVFTTVQGREKRVDRFLTNGYIGGENLVLFDTSDPQLHFLDLTDEPGAFHAEYEILIPDDEMFAGLKELFIRNSEKIRKDPTVIDKVLVKAGRKKVEPIPEGLWYNK
ncbi:MAG: class I SAM-dependent methyltransferase [Lachnospiraceae bacterium]|nr:class I SAM-dependent methyltransferase [Lachnospiraceae bacterium]